MVDERLVEAIRVISHELERLLNFAFDFVVIFHVIKADLALLNKGESESGIEVIKKLLISRRSACYAYLLHSTGLDFEVCWNIVSEYPSLKCFDVTSDICLGCQEMSFICDAMRILVPIGHDDVRLIRFHLRYQHCPLILTYHEESFAKRSTTLPEHVVGIEGDDIAKREDEGVNIFHV